MTKRLALIAVLTAVPLALYGCGGGTETTTVTETGTEPTETTATETTETTTDSGPEGALTSSGIGEVERGASTADAQAAFGDPVRMQEGPGCELAPQSPRSLAWTYRPADGGTVILSFDASTEMLSNYRVTSPGLETERGDRVGDPFETLQEHWGGMLEGLEIGTGATPKAGIWIVKEGPEAELWFDIRGGIIRGISGGKLVVCE